jgi:adenylosuccinate lyase
MINVLNNLNINKKNMMKNLNLLKGLPYSQNVLIFLIENKVLREDAYKIVQDCALKTWKGNMSFKDNLLSHPRLAKLKISSKVNNIFNNKNLFKNVDKIFKRIN